MEVFKIDKKYVTKDRKKVQLMVYNAKSQIIFSYNELIFFKKENNETKINSYINDETRIGMPYWKNPESNMLIELFEFGKIYVRYTSDVGSFLLSDSYDLSFLYFGLLDDGNAYVVVMYRSDFKDNIKTVEINGNESVVYDFLFGEELYSFKKAYNNEKLLWEKVNSRMYGNWEYGIEYFETRKENTLISTYKDNLDLTEQGIISKYNKQNYFYLLNNNKKEVKKIKYVDKFSITKCGFIETYDPIMVVISNENKVYANDFDIQYISPHNFRITMKVCNIFPNEKEINKRLKSANFTMKPTMEDNSNKSPIISIKIKTT